MFKPQSLKGKASVSKSPSQANYKAGRYTSHQLVPSELKQSPSALPVDMEAGKELLQPHTRERQGGI
jgi:hypothetical protein